MLGVLLAFALPAPAQTFTPLPARTLDDPSFVYTPSPADWREVPIYQVITDRFFDGDPSNNDDNVEADVNPFGAISIHGGDFEGLEQKLDYIRMLGQRAIWVSPVVRNVNGVFHGFAAQDFNEIDPHWGSLDDLRALVDAAHARDMYVIIDVVQNHMGDLVTSTDFGYPGFNLTGYNLRWRNTSRRHAPPFDDLGRFHNYGNIGNWGDATQVLLGDFAGLDGIRTEDPGVRQDLTTIYQALIAATDCDGFRVDTARHVEMDFWETFLPALYDSAHGLGKTNFLVYCEAWLGGDSEVGAFTATNRFNSAIYFPMRDTMESVFVWNGNTSWLTDRYDALTAYDPIARYRLVNFLDNHDMSRYLSADKLQGNIPKLKVALAFLYTYLQVPCLYYGTEQGFDGGNDPYDREDMFDGEFEYGPSLGDNFDFTHELFRHVRLLTLLREAYPELARGTFTQRWQSFGGGGLYCFSRILDGNEVFVALNTSSSSLTALNGGIGPSTSFPQGTILANVFDPADRVTVGSGGGGSHVAVTVPGYGFKLYVTEDDLRSLAPSVVYAVPAHNAKDVALASTITLEFDQPMSTGATETAFDLSPPAAGVFAWSAGDTRVAFTPAAPLASNTPYVLTLGADAEATNGLALGAAFVRPFDTGATGTDEKPLGNFVLDGALDAGVPLLAGNNGMVLYAQYDTTNGALYVATLDAGEGNDHFILVDDQLQGMQEATPGWNKNGNAASDGPFLADENDNDFVSWFGVSAAASARTGPNGGVLEGVINVREHYGAEPEYLYLAAAPYPTSDGSTLLADSQVPHSQNFDQHLDSNEFARLTLATGEVLLPTPPGTPGEVPLKQYNLDGQLSATEASTLRTNRAGLSLFADFNGKMLYLACEDAGEGSDHFLFMTPDLSMSNPAPWAKTGRVAGPNHFLADENDNAFAGWFIFNSYDNTLLAASPVINGGYLEGMVDPVDLFGQIPEVLYLAAVPFSTENGGGLYGPGQVPGGNDDGNLDADEFFLLDFRQFDTDADGIPDLEEDTNANGVLDAGETGARVLDTDGDGMHDGAERFVGTNPTDGESWFETAIRRTVSPSNSTPRLAWQSVTGRVYTVLSSDILDGTDGPWTMVGDGVVEGTGAEITFDDTHAPALIRVYRVVAREAP